VLFVKVIIKYVNISFNLKVFKIMIEKTTIEEGIIMKKLPSHLEMQKRFMKIFRREQKGIMKICEDIGIRRPTLKGLMEGTRKMNIMTIFKVVDYLEAKEREFKKNSKKSEPVVEDK